MIVGLNGGLCNQVFQYCFGKSVSKVLGQDLYFDISALGGYRKFMLDPFGFDIKLKSPQGLPVFQERVFAFDPDVYDVQEEMFFSGFWQTEKYFNVPLIRRDIFRLERNRTELENEYLREINSVKNSVMIHVRRTDYLKEPHASFHGNLDNIYYESAIDIICSNKSGVKFFIFSDDPEWCEKNQRYFSNNTVIKGVDEYDSLDLMSCCDHAIIANSTFGWFGAWMAEDPDSIIIGPKNWFKNNPAPDVLPERWIRI